MIEHLHLGMVQAILATLGLSVAAQSAAADSHLPATQVTRDIRYGTGPTAHGDKALLLDLYRPTAPCTDPRPAIIMVHGGGFRTRSKDYGPWPQIAGTAAARGYVAFSIDYRLVGDDPVVAPDFAPVATALEAGHDGPHAADRARIIASAISDATTALRWVAGHASTYCVDPQRIALWGASAGSMTTLMTGYGLDELGIAAPRPAAMVDYWGAELVPDLVRRGAAPLFILQGNADPMVPYAASLKLQAEAKAAGVPYSFITVDGAGHSFGEIPVTTLRYNGETLLDMTLDFLDAHLRGGSAPAIVATVPGPAKSASDAGD